MNRARKYRTGVILVLAFAICSECEGQSDLDLPPINYQTAPRTDRVGLLQQQLESGDKELKWDEQHGWLPALLQALDVPSSSQTLVFSKTSQQARKITPSKPRAIYFNDEIYVGWVQKGDFVELASVDPELGAVFYTVDQHISSKPVFTADSLQCLSCHASGKTKRVPGFLVRSVFPKSNGHPEYRLGTLPTDHTTPFDDRFGGWYVTGQHGGMRHRGNVFVTGDESDPIDRQAGANLATLPKRVKPDDYLKPGSDVVALMLLEHQTQMHNHVTRAAYSTRQALHHQAEMNRLFERDEDYRSESTVRRIHKPAEELVKYLFFSGEFELTAPVSGNDEFIKDFAREAVRDSQGRSLKDLDLQTRLLRYPCSYLIYSKSFLSLPPPTLKVIKSRMLEVLAGQDQSEAFAHLSAADRKNVLEILVETHPLFQSDAKDGPRE